MNSTRVQPFEEFYMQPRIRRKDGKTGDQYMDLPLVLQSSDYLITNLLDYKKNIDPNPIASHIH